MSEARFTPHSLAEILRDRFLDESSGCLILTAQTGEEIRIHFFRGLIDMALQTGPHLEFLSDLAATARVRAALPAELRDGPPGPARLAAFLGDDMKRPEVIKAVRREADVSIQEAFRLSGGTWHLEKEDTAGLFEPDVVGTLEAILTGIGAVERWAQVGRTLSSQNRVLVPSRVPLFPINQLPLAPEEGYLLSLMDGNATFSQIGSLFPGSDPDQVTRFVYSALVIGAVEFDPALGSPFRLEQYTEKEESKREREAKEREKIERFYAMLSGGTPFQVLGVTDGASWSEIKQAYDERKTSYQTEQFLPSIRRSCREELQIISTGLVEAYLKIQSMRMDEASEKNRERTESREISLEEMQGKRLQSTKTSRQEHIAEQDHLAELYLRKARDAFREADFHNTIEYCSLALKKNDDIAELHSLLGQALARNPARRWQVRAEQSLKRACDLDQWNPLNYQRLGEFYRNQGLEQRAGRCFEKARTLSQPQGNRGPTRDRA